MKRVLIPIAALVASGLLGGVAAVAAWEAVADDDEQAGATAEPARPVADGTALDLRELYRRALPAVVEVSVGQADDADEDQPQPRPRRAPPFPMPPNAEPTATGSGFVIDEDGHIVTNEHVVGDAETVTVTFSDGDEATARVVGTDPSSDVALLELEGDRDVAPLELGASEDLEVGDPVAALGSPFGLEGTLTSGIVSAVDREIQAPNGFTIDGAIQTDAALNRGNSGGPLLDLQGRVVGVTSQIESSTGGNAGVGYAVPIETVREVVDELLEEGEVRYAYLGVRLEDTDDGVRIAEVIERGPAARAGLRQGDVVVEAGGQEVATADDLRRQVTSREPGERLALEVRRGDETRTFDVELGQRPGSVE